ncbi:nucleotidyltransferase family protein [Pseudomonas alliivorans]|uniref:nucleotidyltransferase family protein n=1 Tax=Pseudomonas alliivorans TaxID=2810613 RepID=UPI001AE51546|nr:nucleotidyltransferase family protein [Pseudomonas alliivorans]MBP0941404.1 nucleotidyltransferase family protein [Pseudomonas alliivorans]MEE4732945.1 nucleotidyltransferase family protein [Pseudomonas alliivorans]MEE4880692.1 nucleotidyltransferase family protein [Pseudomonas alliivorans]MEE4931060.1 nucleotidyltransferase family protein [Pseudomonas alliivorans]MEE4936334.1 nucleotidyltransferase family protein [Pseudomonas alliivorans]
MTSIDSPIPQVFALLLAAGRSRRFDGDKRLATLPCGRTLLRASIENALHVFNEVWVVLREEDDTELLGVPLEVKVVRSPQTDLGMGHSLASGIAALMPSSADAVAVLLADMPWIQPATLQSLASMANPRRIALPGHDGQRGHPVIIGRDFWPLLLNLEGDQGAKSIIKSHPERCDVLVCEDPGILRDADTRAALALACQTFVKAADG